jgi:hypothetical protein
LNKEQAVHIRPATRADSADLAILDDIASSGLATRVLARGRVCANGAAKVVIGRWNSAAAEDGYPPSSMVHHYVDALLEAQPGPCADEARASTAIRRDDSKALALYTETARRACTRYQTGDGFC